MNVYIKLSILFVFITLVSCTDVIEVEVPVAAPRLVVEASLDWEKGTLGNNQTIFLSLSEPYFDSEGINYVNGALVIVTNNATSAVFNFEDQNNGSYIASDFIPIEGDEYTLEIIYNNETYTAVETLIPVSDIKEVYQSTDQGFSKDDMEVNVTFDDPAGIENFYFMKFFHRQGNILPVLYDISDEFTDGNEMRVFYEDEFVPGDIVDINLNGISKQYYNYIRLLIEQSSDGGPFSTIPAQLKGNCINVTTPDNYAFGYFRLTQVSKAIYMFE